MKTKSASDRSVSLRKILEIERFHHAVEHYPTASRDWSRLRVRSELATLLTVARAQEDGLKIVDVSSDTPEFDLKFRSEVEPELPTLLKDNPLWLALIKKEGPPWVERLPRRRPRNSARLYDTIGFKFSIAFELGRNEIANRFYYITLLRNGMDFNLRDQKDLEELAFWLRDGFSYLTAQQHLSRKEKTILELYHLQSKEIAQKIGDIEPETVDVHRKNIRSKMSQVGMEDDPGCWHARNSLRLVA